jgi:hypothetical protein
LLACGNTSDAEGPLEQNRRRIDQVTDPEFVANLRDLGIAELRERRRICDELDTELSYYRRLLHGRLDLLTFEQRRRRGEESRSLIEALPEILAGQDTATSTRSLLPRTLPIEAPDMGDGRRPIDRVLSDDFLTHLPSISDAELDEIEESLATTERAVSSERRAVYDALEQILEELTRRYREGLADVDQLLRHG